VRQFGGGHANLTYQLCYGEGDDAIEYVLRRPPLGPVAATAHDMKREYRVLSKLWQAFPKAPRAFLFCEDPSVIGAEFVVMERRHGIVVRAFVPPEFGGGKDPVANRKLSEVVIGTLVEFHAVDPASVGLESLGKPAGFLERQVAGWTGRYERAKTTEIPIANEVNRWLLENRPESPPATLVHNDWKLDNMAVAEDDPGRCVAVYDWDMCTIGDPMRARGSPETIRCRLRRRASCRGTKRLGTTANAPASTLRGFRTTWYSAPSRWRSCSNRSTTATTWGRLRMNVSPVWGRSPRACSSWRPNVARCMKGESIHATEQKLWSRCSQRPARQR
jgi:hypothetical protein